MIYRVIYISPFPRSAGRPERMGHNTCKSMGRVLCVVRRQIGPTLTKIVNAISTGNHK